MTSAPARPAPQPGPWPALLAGTAAALWACVLGPIPQGAVAGIFLLGVVAWWTLSQASRWVVLFLGAALCLPPLPLALGNSGPHPALAAAALGLIAGIQHRREWGRPLPRASLWLVVYLLALAASIPFAALYSGAAVAGASLARMMLFGISVYVFFFTAGGPDNATDSDEAVRLRFIYWAGVLSAAFACLDFYYQFPAPSGFGPQFVWLQSGVYRRAQGVFYEASTLGNVCAFFLIFVAICMTRPRREIPLARVSLLAGAVVFLAALMLSFSRASVINLGVALAVLAILHRDRLRPLRLGAILAAGLGVGLMAMYALIPAFVEFYWVRLRASVELLLGGNESVLSGRLYTWKLLAGFLLDHPGYALFGVGYKTLPYSGFIGQTAVADNGYLSALVETGLLGLGLLALFHVAILRMSWRAAHSENQRAAFFGAWMLCFWAGEMVQMLSGDLLTYWRVLPLYFWVLALAVRHSLRQDVT